MEKPIKTSNTTLLAAALALCAIPACGMDQNVSAHGQIIDRTTHALSAGSVKEIKGSYSAACKDRSSGTWSVGDGDVSFTLDNAPLSVVLNNSLCRLTMTSVRLKPASGPAAEYSASNRELADTYGSPLAFKLGGAGSTVFYGNANLTPADFSADFVLGFLYSEDPSAADGGSKTAGFTQQYGSATFMGGTPPNYTATVSGLSLATDINNVVQSAGGVVVLTNGVVGPHLGTEYVVSKTDLSSTAPTYLEVYNAYNASSMGEQKLLLADLSTPLNIPAADLRLVGEDITADKTRAIIIANFDAGGNPSYEVITVTFHNAQ